MKTSLFALGLIVITALCGHAHTLPAAENIEIYARAPSRTSQPARLTREGIPGLAKQVVATSHYKHKYQYYAKARAGLAEYSSSTARFIVLPLAESFAATIITEIDATAQTLSFTDKQIFWKSSGKEIKKFVTTFCNEHGVTSTENLYQKIDNVIQMKAKFG